MYDEYKVRDKADALKRAEPDRRLKLVYEWVKKKDISYREFEELLKVALHYGRNHMVQDDDGNWMTEQQYHDLYA